MDFPFLKKFAMGYYFDKPGRFETLITPYLPALAEIYFPLPGILSARELSGDEDQMRTQLVRDLLFARQNGLKLDLLINATCYGEKSFTAEWRRTLVNAIKWLNERGVKPEIVTTTSPFAAKVIKEVYPEIEIRASVNLKIGSLLAMEYVEDTYDSFYMSRDFQRDLPTLKMFSEWCSAHGKKLCMLANSGCLRNCPSQVFHETLLAHGFHRSANEVLRMKSEATLCWNQIVEKKHFEEVLRATWVRPEDLHHYAPFVEVFKISTRNHPAPAEILHAYATGHFDGNLMNILDPSYSEPLAPKMIDNSAFPEDWVTGGIAGACAVNCTHCGKCTAVLEKVLKDDPNYKPPQDKLYSFSMGAVSAGKYSFR